MRTKSSAPRPAPALPDRALMHEAAVAYLARYAASAAAVRRVLHRRIERWAAQACGERADIAARAQAARTMAEQVVSALVQAGAIDDATYAASRARSLARSGRSGPAITALLLRRGIEPEMATASARVHEEDELAAALALARRRRIGPFRRGPADPTQIRREAAVFARAGFSRAVAAEALGMPVDLAEALVLKLKSA